MGEENGHRGNNLEGGSAASAGADFPHEVHDLVTCQVGVRTRDIERRFFLRDRPDGEHRSVLPSYQNLAVFSRLI